jgi:CDP-diacylglycerol---glycerol-3-phosphate 3-phosphatidyltransferase
VFREYFVRNLPNLMSMGRLLSTIPLVVLILINTAPAFLIAAALHAAGSATDWFDGRLARRYHVVSRLGVFLDLSADKVLVAAALIALVQVGVVPAWVAIVIVTREFVVQGLRSLAAVEGKVIPAGMAGKWKTTFTLAALGGIFLALGLRGKTAFPLGLSTSAAGPHGFADYLLAASDALMLLAVVWTLYSAWEYLRGTWGLLTEPAKEQ